ncbi:alpha/beta hydrolase [Sphingomonas piscis]|uniref:Alpha/beta hydrolase n=1 Tax=Sphingomonas piscis TaxID=2714943 RepID=A0A6G7YM62_9SPHN|nr:alpha/beta hydrolase [Sphingomonas piscis]QIK77817.1 alpha/beta hydrolase [Sphingomonas piscis]
MTSRPFATILVACSLLTAPARAEVASGTLRGGAQWTAETPPQWNGTLLLYSRGYSFNLPPAEAAPTALRAELLKAGYAIAGSNYGASGWSVEQAVPAQIETIAAFAGRFGRPRNVIAWGYSMGGLVTTALAEQRSAGISGAAPFCSSMGGAVGMMNMGLDGAFAFRTLIAPRSDIRLVGIDDDLTNAKRVKAAIDRATTTPQGRARIALAGVLAGLPDWTSGEAPPATDDERIRQMAAVVGPGSFLPRVDQERRAGGNFSWNSGVDYRKQLARSGRLAFVQAAYRRAGLDLSADLARLSAAPRIAAAPGAVDYMMRNYTPTARPLVPMVAVQAVGDGITSPSLQQGYVDAARGDVRSLWLRQSGHCTFKPATVLSALNYLQRRVTSGRWPARPADFADHRAPPMLRPCYRGQRCR